MVGRGRPLDIAGSTATASPTRDINDEFRAKKSGNRLTEFLPKALWVEMIKSMVSGPLGGHRRRRRARARPFCGHFCFRHASGSMTKRVDNHVMHFSSRLRACLRYIVFCCTYLPVVVMFHHDIVDVISKVPQSNLTNTIWFYPHGTLLSPGSYGYSAL